MSKNKLIAKVRNLSDIQQQIAFTEHDFYQRYVEIFCGISSQLGEYRLRMKYNDREKANLAYMKQLKHIHKQTQKMIMRPWLQT